MRMVVIANNWLWQEDAIRAHHEQVDVAHEARHQQVVEDPRPGGQLGEKQRPHSRLAFLSRRQASRYPDSLRPSSLGCNSGQESCVLGSLDGKRRTIQIAPQPSSRERPSVPLLPPRRRRSRHILRPRGDGLQQRGDRIHECDRS